MSVISTASSALNAFQAALSVTGNNITNVSTAGYSRQTIQLVPTLTQKFGNSYIGSGVGVLSIERTADAFANYQLRESNSIKSQYDTFYQQASQIDSLLSQNGVSLSASMQTFFGAINQLNSAPDSSSSRSVALQQSQLMTSQFNYMQNKLDEYQTNSTTQISEALKQINTTTQNIASLNKQLLATPNAPDLLDQRDKALQDISQFGAFNIVNQSNGTVSVSFPSGELLVSGPANRELSVSAAKSSTFGSKILLGGIDVSEKFTGGLIKGQLDFEQNILGQATQVIGQMAIGLSQTFNAQHQLGVNMNNTTGSNYFTDYNTAAMQAARSIAAASNTGTAQISVSISNVSQLKISDYDLSVTDAATNQYSLVRRSDGATIPLTWNSSTSAAPATLSVVSSGNTDVDGMTITVDDITHLANNDQFTLTPTRDAAKSFKTLLSDPRDIALAAAVRTNAPSANKGQATIALGTVFDTTEVHTNYNIEISPSDPTQYRVLNVDTGTYYPTSPSYDSLSAGSTTISLPPDGVAPPGTPSISYNVVLSGKPAAGDVFNLGYNSGAVGDNRNGLLLADIQKNKVFSGGTESLVDRYADLVSGVGSDTSQSKFRSDSATVVYNQAVSYQGSKSGVNLDEEAANLLKYKQAYEAAGKLMQVSSDMMKIIFSMIN